MATATIVHLIVYRLCECYGTGRATSHGLSAATAPVNRGLRDSGLHFLHQVFCAHRMR